MRKIFKIDAALYLLGALTALSGFGLWHYKLGIVFAIFAIGHATKRFHILRKAIRR